MKRFGMVLAAASALALGVPAHANQSYEARVTASAASRSAHDDMVATFGREGLKPGRYLWREDAQYIPGDQRLVISLGDQLAYLYHGNELVAVASISSGKDGKESPSGVFQILSKTPMHRSKKYNDAAMPFAQFITEYGVALHAGPNPGYPASHGCIRLPSAFAKKLYAVTEVGTPVLIGA